jgi:two-component sensor histidine kinase
MPKPRRKKKPPKRVLALPDLEQTKSAVINSLPRKVGSGRTSTQSPNLSIGIVLNRGLAFNRTVVLRYRIYLEQRLLAPTTINLHLAAVRRVAYEAADSGLLSPELAAGMPRVKGVRRIGVRLGNCLTADQGRSLLLKAAVHGLRLSAVVNNDLTLAISALAKELAADQTSGDCPDVRVQVEGTPRDLHPILRDEVYRIAAEALRNACRHSEARQIEVEIRYDEGQLRLWVRDNGKGINPNVLDGDRPLGHWGLSGMRERAKLVNGKLDVWSKLDSGTKVELTIPASVAYGTSPAPRRPLFSRVGRS